MPDTPPVPDCIAKALEAWFERHKTATLGAQDTMAQAVWDALAAAGKISYVDIGGGLTIVIAIPAETSDA